MKGNAYKVEAYRREIWKLGTKIHLPSHRLVTSPEIFCCLLSDQNCLFTNLQGEQLCLHPRNHQHMQPSSIDRQVLTHYMSVSLANVMMQVLLLIVNQSVG